MTFLTCSQEQQDTVFMCSRLLQPSREYRYLGGISVLVWVWMECPQFMLVQALKVILAVQATPLNPYLGPIGEGGKVVEANFCHDGFFQEKEATYATPTNLICSSHLFTLLMSLQVASVQVSIFTSYKKRTLYFYICLLFCPAIMLDLLKGYVFVKQ